MESRMVMVMMMTTICKTFYNYFYPKKWSHELFIDSIFCY